MAGKKKLSPQKRVAAAVTANQVSLPISGPVEIVKASKVGALGVLVETQKGCCFIKYATLRCLPDGKTVVLED